MNLSASPQEAVGSEGSEGSDEDEQPQLLTDPYLTSLGLQVNHLLHALICTACQQGVAPHAVKHHLSEKHRDAKIRVDPEELARVIEEYDLEQGFPIIMNHAYPPFHGLAKYQGFSCKNCNFACCCR
jgi:hypothetical protein